MDSTEATNWVKGLLIAEDTLDFLKPTITSHEIKFELVPKSGQLSHLENDAPVRNHAGDPPNEIRKDGDKIFLVVETD